MGKAAINAKLKLRAAFYNNIAVGFIVSGIVIPPIALIGYLLMRGKPLSNIAGQFVSRFPEATVCIAGWYIIGFLIVVLCRMYANRTLSKIVD